MNPKIKAYWENFYGVEAFPNETNAFWQVRPKEGHGVIIIALKYEALSLLDRDGKYAFPHLKDDDWVYTFNGQPRDEETMLRMLDLKAFL